jgi:hypothetical protein
VRECEGGAWASASNGGCGRAARPAATPGARAVRSAHQPALTGAGPLGRYSCHAWERSIGRGQRPAPRIRRSPQTVHPPFEGRRDVNSCLSAAARSLVSPPVRLQAESQPSSFWRIAMSQSTVVTCPQVACGRARGVRRCVAISESMSFQLSRAPRNVALCDRGGSHE